MSQVVTYNSPQELVLAQEQAFNQVLTDNKISFAREAEFAIQHLNNNQYLAKIAGQNQRAMADAVKNVAAIGISLNPAEKHAHLVPRDGKVCLDIGYLGLLHIATQSGSILWAQCKVVYAGDTYESNGVDRAPTHKYNPFAKGEREPIGAYCVAKTADGAYLTEEMSIDDIHAIRSRSMSFSKGRNSPWKTDYKEMVRKTVIKRAYKYWPKTERMSNAVEMLNQQEGINFNSEQGGMRDINPDHETLSSIRQGLELLGRPEGAFLNYFAQNVAKRGIPSLEDATADEAKQMLSLVNQFIDQQAKKDEDVF